MGEAKKESKKYKNLVEKLNKIKRIKDILMKKKNLTYFDVPSLEENSN